MSAELHHCDAQVHTLAFLARPAFLAPAGNAREGRRMPI